MPDEYLKAKRGLAVLRELARSDVYVSNAAQDYRNFLFDYRRNQPHFEVLCQDADVAEWLTQTCLDRWPRRGSGGAYSLEEWFRRTAHSLVIYGHTYEALDFTEDDSAYLAFDEPRWLPVETMRALLRRGAVLGFVQQYSQHAEQESVGGARFEFEADEVLWLKWPRALPPGREGVSPISTVVPHVKGVERFRQWSLLNSYAAVHPEDKRFHVERARYGRYETRRRQHDSHVASILAKMGVPQAFHHWDVPLTDYFIGWELCRFGEYVAILRDYLVGQFNEQVLRVWAKRNSVEALPELRLVGYPSHSDWQDALQQHEHGQLTLDGIHEMLRGSLD